MVIKISLLRELKEGAPQSSPAFNGWVNLREKPKTKETIEAEFDNQNVEIKSLFKNLNPS